VWNSRQWSPRNGTQAFIPLPRHVWLEPRQLELRHELLLSYFPSPPRRPAVELDMSLIGL